MIYAIIRPLIPNKLDELTRPSTHACHGVMINRSCTGRPVVSFTFVTQVFIWPSKVPWRLVFKVWCQVTWSDQTSLLLWTVASDGFWCPTTVATVNEIFGYMFPVQDPYQAPDAAAWKCKDMYKHILPNKSHKHTHRVVKYTTCTCQHIHTGTHTQVHMHTVAHILWEKVSQMSGLDNALFIFSADACN